MKIYGIPNCNTVKKAREFLEENGLDYSFIDYKKAGTDRALLTKWMTEFGWEKVINRAGMTWRKLSEEEKASIQTINDAIALAESSPSIIKRPILETGDQTLIGFKEGEYQKLTG